jgi:hypothetical protein
MKNKLTPDELERLTLLAKEMNKTIHVIGKIMNDGYSSSISDNSYPTSNRELLEEELGNVFAAIELMNNKNDISLVIITRFKNLKINSLYNKIISNWYSIFSKKGILG